MLDSDTYISLQIATLKVLGDESKDIKTLVENLKSAFAFEEELITEGPAAMLSLQAYEDSATFLAGLDVVLDAIDKGKPLG